MLQRLVTESRSPYHTVSDCGSHSGYGHELGASVSRVQILVPLKTRLICGGCKTSRWLTVVVRTLGCYLRCCLRHLTKVQNYEVRHQ
ncbi:hypothetical protein TNCV_1144451 [Trichonephila clavipes]|nr:hypothetical protein TNCV_1144451 [Trichonephila clavipes]